ncbi:MAG: hypothetical protein KGI26_00310 [Thaumarchaeota archaeon]|nr:hypothetical protein [Nitrososphaerota archaeon]
MTVTKPVFYGVAVVLVAFLLVTSALAAVYYGEYQQERSLDMKHQTELSLALANYNSLTSLYNYSLGYYNETLSLLAGAVSSLNTSTPAYRAAAADLASLWLSYQTLANGNGHRALVYNVRMVVDYGNGTSRWYNDSTAQPGWNGYVVSLVLLRGDVQATWYPQYGEHFVTGIDGVNQTSNSAWFVWEFANGGWTPSVSGSDQLQVVNGTVLAWTLCGYDASFNPACTP